MRPKSRLTSNYAFAENREGSHAPTRRRRAKPPSFAGGASKALAVAAITCLFVVGMMYYATDPVRVKSAEDDGRLSAPFLRHDFKSTKIGANIVTGNREGVPRGVDGGAWKEKGSEDEMTRGGGGGGSGQNAATRPVGVNKGIDEKAEGSISAPDMTR